jgi:hypothetical protein
VGIALYMDHNVPRVIGLVRLEIITKAGELEDLAGRVQFLPL